MGFKAEEIVKMCEDAPVIEPQYSQYAMLEINPGEKAHIKFIDADVYIIAAQNTKKLFRDITFAGYLVAIVTPSKIKGYSYFDYRGFYTTNTGLLFSGKKNDSWVRTVSDNETILMTYDFDHYDDVCSSLYKAQQKAYNNCEALYRSDLQELTDAQPNFRLENGRLIF